MQLTERTLVIFLLITFFNYFASGTTEELLQDALREIRERGPFYYLVPSHSEDEASPNHVEGADEPAVYSNHVSGKNTAKRPGTACPYSVWSNGCNLCTCDSDGEVRCTRDSCPTLTMSAARRKRHLIIKPFYRFRHGAKNRPACMFGSKWVDGCFECICNSTEQISCHRLVGCHREGHKLEYCPFGDSGWSDGCFKCLCQNDGRPHCHRLPNCTRRRKLAGMLSQRQYTVVRRSIHCRLGSWWHDGCDTCSCIHSSRAVCTTHCLRDT
ncbi:uncharacterized protein LOC106168860 isoform X1 [Lingula anatina]|uniref:Uncharacterized protein LOC106168860 isoform X1 n=1 Tax=Lingula anatina TaxID=7574 RepID=A0A1S3IZ94_LINAN|nr:uncharacterized protein LOC106168860 isoform X1 [Lingula anatina]|eukprot:XP_013403522.1 uncharacterized protein LOC106168860 isoform X1 [Lingula anatina]